MVAAQAGFTSAGMWVDPLTSWQGDALEKTRQALSDTGIALIDVEVVWLKGASEPDDLQKQIVDAGMALGARNVLVVSRHDDFDASVRQFRGLCERVAGDMRVVLEFGEFTTIKTLAAAIEFIGVVDHPSAGILIDLMHLNRSGETLPELPSKLFPYIQACDFHADSVTLTGHNYVIAAIDGRAPLGEGDASAEVLRAVCQRPVDVSLEIRSKPLRDQYPDPVERARQIFARCRRSG
ncbi:MAG: TIM barrel protein [Proteobacteria bacterium]|nr:TIM barrel protein [Pseudomonadota bacterium]